MAVQVPADLLVPGVAPVDDHAVGMEALPAAGTGLQAAAEAALLMTRAERAIGIVLVQVPAGPNVPSGLSWFRFPQCRVPEVLLRPFTFSMMSISPVAGHPLGASIQNPGQ